MGISLPSIPTELIENVASFIEHKKDLLALRLVCTDICRKTRNVFLKVFYHTIETSLSRASIERLQQIAKQRHLRENVKELHFVAHGEVNRNHRRSLQLAGHRRTLHRTFGIGYEWRKEQRFSLNSELIWGCEAILALSELLINSFTNCRRFCVGDDGADWALGDCYRSDCIVSLDVMAVLLRIIATTGLQVQSFAIHSRVLVSQMNMATPGFHYHPKLWDFDRFRESWGGLHSLDLELTEHNFEEDETHFEDSAEANARLICAAKNLRRLRLANYSSAWDDKSLMLKEICKGGFTPPLEVLVLKLSLVSADALIMLLSQLGQTLRSVVLHETWLQSGTWDSVLFSLESREHFPKLNSITLAALKVTRFGRLSFHHLHHDRCLPTPFEHEKFEMLYRPAYDFRGLHGVRYRGDNVPVAVDKLRKYMQHVDKDEDMKDGLESDFCIDEWRW